MNIEPRKLIQFGKSSLVISMPKSWVEKHNLNKGDVVYVDEKSYELNIHPSVKEETYEPQEIIINVDGKDSRMIKEEIIAAYVNNYNNILIKGNELNKHAEKIRNHVHNLMALEIMEQGTNKIVAKDFLNMKQTSIKSLMRKADLITKDMLADTKKVSSQEQYLNLYQRDEDVNRLTYLIFRAVRYGLENPAVMKNFKLPSVEIIDLFRISINIEQVADSAKRIAKLLADEDAPLKQREKILKIFDKAEKYYLDTMKVCFTKNTKEALKLALIKRDLLDECDGFLNDNNSMWFVKSLSMLKQMIVNTHHIAKVVLIMKEEKSD